MQFFGIGILELLVILVLAMLVVGPQRLPEFAAELAKFIRRARSYAQYLARDFDDVVKEIEREVGTSRDDWKEIAGAVGLQTRGLADELNKTLQDAHDATDLEKMQRDGGPLAPPVNGASAEATPAASNGDAPAAEAAPESMPTAERESAEADAGKTEDEWYVPDRPRRRRRRTDE